MSISGGYSKYADDRDPSIVEMIADGDTEAKKKWHQVSRIDANGADSAATRPPAASRFGHFAETSDESGITPGRSRKVKFCPLEPARCLSIGCAARAIASATSSPDANSAAVTR